MSRTASLLHALAGAVLLTMAPLGSAWADDPEDGNPLDDIDLLEGDDDEDDDDTPTRLDSGDDVDIDEPEDLDSIEMIDDEDVGEDLLGEDGEPEDVLEAAEDSATVYRDYQDMVEGMEPDEEVPAWERYLRKYPATAFRTRIERRIDELMEFIYSERIDDGPRIVDADDREIKFAQALLLENINPRTRIQAGFEWGLPNYMNLFGSYEYQIKREFSVHGGIRRRYTGWSLESGARWAIVKSQRTQTLVTLIGDVHLNASPAFIGFRPQLAFGKKFGDKLHAQLQAGVDVEARNPVGLRVIGGANVTYVASDQVALFLETSVNMKNFTWTEGRPFQFDILSFGLKFYPTPGTVKKQQLEMNVGASAPVFTDYWMYHFGSIMGQFNYYPE